MLALDLIAIVSVTFVTGFLSAPKLVKRGRKRLGWNFSTTTALATVRGHTGGLQLNSMRLRAATHGLQQCQAGGKWLESCVVLRWSNSIMHTCPTVAISSSPGRS